MQTAAVPAGVHKGLFVARTVLRNLQHSFVMISNVSPPDSPTHMWTHGLSQLPLDQVCQLADAAKEVLHNDPSLLELASPTYIIGDLHGNYLVCFSSLFSSSCTVSLCM